jgi:hypothetical protein
VSNQRRKVALWAFRFLWQIGSAPDRACKMKLGSLPSPKPTVTEYRTLDTYLTEALEIPFDQKYLKRSLINAKTTDAVNEAFHQYDAQFRDDQYPDGRFPFRPDNEVRVGIFRQERVGGRTIMPVSIVGDLRPIVKSALLFCHSALVTAPLRMKKPDFYTDEQYFDETFGDLEEAFSYGTLVPRKVIIPIDTSLHIGGNFDDPWTRPYQRPGSQVGFSRPEERAIDEAGRWFKKDRPDLTLSEAKNLVIRALMARSECNLRGLAYDVFFRDRDTAEAYSACVAYMQTAMSSNDAKSPLRLFSLTSEIGVDPSKIADEDFVNLRENEEAFEIWRKIAAEVLDRTSSGKFSDSEKELREFVAEQQQRWHAEAQKALGGGFLSTVLDRATEALVGAAVGSAAGHIIDNRWIVSGAVAGAAKPLIGILGAAAKNLKNGPARASFNRHYLALTKRPLSI